MPVPFRVPRFYPILDTILLQKAKLSPFMVAEILVGAGARILQYRHKESWTQREFDDAAKIRTLCHDAGVLFVMNDRADFAKLLGAALHIGQRDLPPLAARRVVSDEVIGFSTHNRTELVRGDEEPVEYLSLGPIFETTSKENPDPVLGLTALKQLRPLTEKPLVAIGGIRLDNALEVLAEGASSVAVISGILPANPDKSGVKKLAAEWMKLLA